MSIDGDLPPGFAEPPLPDVGFGRVVELRGDQLAELLDVFAELRHRHPYLLTVGVDAEGFKWKPDNGPWRPGRGTVRSA